jgi:hypothetical protein
VLVNTSSKVVPVLATDVKLARFTSVNPEPPAGAAHLSPVAVALSATKPAILQEQSQRIVLRGLKPLNPQQLNQVLIV